MFIIVAPSLQNPIVQATMLLLFVYVALTGAARLQKEVNLAYEKAEEPNLNLTAANSSFLLEIKAPKCSPCIDGFQGKKYAAIAINRYD